MISLQEHMRRLRKLESLLDDLGIWIVLGEFSNETVCYRPATSKNNPTIYLSVGMDDFHSPQNIIFNIAHELGHYLVASPSRRNKKDYGIPPIRYGELRPKWDEDEYRAQRVEREITERLGYRGEKYYSSSYGYRVEEWWTSVGKKQTRDQLKGWT